MQERSEAGRSAKWPCLNVATWRRERSDRAIQQIRQNSTAFHSIPAIRSKGSTSVLSTRKIRPIYSHPISAHFGDNNVARKFRRLKGQICLHTPSALNAGAKRSGATCHMAMSQCGYLAKGAKRPSHTTNMLTSSN